MSEAYPRHRGVSIYGDVIYFGTADSFLVALDARTGAKRGEVQTGDYRTGEGHAHPPLIADGKEFIGTTGTDGSIQCARSGHVLFGTGDVQESRPESRVLAQCALHCLAFAEQFSLVQLSLILLDLLERGPVESFGLFCISLSRPDLVGS
jgi:outer membrane protein assembly factor BamB